VDAHVKTNEELGGQIRRIDALIEDLENCEDPDARDQARALVAALLEFHGAALTQLFDHVRAAGPPGRAIVEALARDPAVSGLLLLHGLHPHDLDVRVARALEEVRPQLQAHGGDVELIGLDGGVVRLRMRGSCHGCPSSAATLKQTIEAAIYDAAPDVAAVEVEGGSEPPGHVADGRLVILGSMPPADGRQRTGAP
jgi:Fe-S cluster biogenesis protein NfuA